MARTREIKGRIKAVANIKRITKTMQMIATARFQAAQRRAIATQPYARKIAELVAEVASSTGGKISHPLLRSTEGGSGRRLLLVLTSNRGLAGGYNGNVLRKAMNYLRVEHAGQQVDVELVGKKGQAYFRFNKTPIAQFHSQFTDKPAFDEVERLAERYMKKFAEGEYDAVDVCYMSFVSMAKQTPTVQPLLPLQAPQGSGVAVQADYDYSPDPQTLLSELLPITVKTTLFQAFNESIVCEQLARMVAMKAATDAASKMGKALTRRYNRARQAAITTELTEVISGAASLQ